MNNMDIEKGQIISADNNVYYEEKRRIGNTFAFWYRKGEPMIVIGPHCK